MPAYSKEDRRADLRRGRTDGRKRVPSYTHLAARIDSEGFFTTPYTEELWEIGRNRIEAELAAYGRRSAPKRERLAGLRSSLATAQQAAADGLDAIGRASAELTQAELLPRNPQEAARDATYLRSRRTSMRERRIQVERDLHTARLAAVADLERRIAETCEELDQSFATAQGRARGTVEHIKIRIATYWGALAATHSEGRQLALILPCIRTVSPEWLSATSRCGVITADDEER